MNKYILSSLTGLCLLVLPCTAQIPNGGFETWNDVGGFDDPDQWVSFNSLSFPIGGVLTCEEGMPGAVGASFVKVTTKNVPGVGLIPGTLYTSADPIGLEGFPHAARSATLTGKWQYAINAGDQGYITVSMSKWNSTTQQRDIIGVGAAPVTGTLASWQSFSMPINYIDPQNPDTAVIYINSSAGIGADGSTIWVDDLAFGAVTGVEQQVEPQAFELYPSPATDVVRINARDRIASVALFDVRGREVRNTTINELPATVNVNELPAGMYIARVRFADGRLAAQPFVKN